jgi:hypothetical protein
VSEKEETVKKLFAQDEALNGCSSSPLLDLPVNNARCERARGETWKYHYSNENSAIFIVQYLAVQLIKMKALSARFNSPATESTSKLKP